MQMSPILKHLAARAYEGVKAKLHLDLMEVSGQILTWPLNAHRRSPGVCWIEGGVWTWWEEKFVTLSRIESRSSSHQPVTSFTKLSRFIPQPCKVMKLLLWGTGRLTSFIQPNKWVLAEKCFWNLISVGLFLKLLSLHGTERYLYVMEYSKHCN